MKDITRRKFLKAALALTAALPVMKSITPQSIFCHLDRTHSFLTVDRDGNAFLCGADLTVDKDHNAVVSERM